MVALIFLFICTLFSEHFLSSQQNGAETTEIPHTSPLHTQPPHCQHSPPGGMLAALINYIGTMLGLKFHSLQGALLLVLYTLWLLTNI